MIRNMPEVWDIEADLVVAGSGIGGLSGAITAHDHGAAAIVLERSEQVGGVTALSLGEVWVPGNHHAKAAGIEDSADSGFRYLHGLAMGYGDAVAALNFAVHAEAALKYFEETAGLRMTLVRDCPDYYYGFSNDAVAEGRMLEVLPFPGASLGEWQSRTRVSPLVPYGMTHVDMFTNGGGSANMMRWDYDVMGARLARDERCLGAGLAAYFVKGVVDRGIPMHTGAEVRELIGDGERVIGVRAAMAGRDVFVKANRGVLLAVSSYERNPDYNKTLGGQLDTASMLFSAIDGANFRLAGPVGARVARVPDITALGIRIPGEEYDTGEPLWRNVMGAIGLPHTIVVNRMGRRFGDESFYRAILYSVDAIDGGVQTHPNYPCWAILDSQAREKYPFGGVMPGQELPDGVGVKADTLEALAQAAGVDADGLVATVAAFNPAAERGEDPQFNRGSHPWSAWSCGDRFHRPHPNLGALAKPPFYAIPLHRLGGSGIPAMGLLADEHCRVVGWDDQPIPGLYCAGNSMARMDTGAMMQSGVSNARGMTHGYLVGLHAAGRPSERLEEAKRRLKVEA